MSTFYSCASSVSYELPGLICISLYHCCYNVTHRFLFDLIQVRSDIMVPLHLITYVGAGIGVIFLVITFFILLCLPNLHCNLNSIHINFVFMLIAAELTFLVGVNTEIVVRKVQQNLVLIAA